MRAIVTVIGPDQKGIIAAVCAGSFGGAGRQYCGYQPDRDAGVFYHDHADGSRRGVHRYRLTEVRPAHFPMRVQRLGLSIRIQNEGYSFNAMHRI